MAARTRTSLRTRLANFCSLRAHRISWHRTLLTASLPTGLSSFLFYSYFTCLDFFPTVSSTRLATTRKIRRSSTSSRWGEGFLFCFLVSLLFYSIFFRLNNDSVKKKQHEQNSGGQCRRRQIKKKFICRVYMDEQNGNQSFDHLLACQHTNNQSAKHTRAHFFFTISPSVRRILRRVNIWFISHEAFPLVSPSILRHSRDLRQRKIIKRLVNIRFPCKVP